MVVPKLTDLTYADTLVIKSTHEYNVHGTYGANFASASLSTTVILRPHLLIINIFLHHCLKSYMYNSSTAILDISKKNFKNATLLRSHLFSYQ